LLQGRAREGVRSAMTPVFEAVAHRNPYPRDMFDEDGWNHMVLKALFIGSTLDPIQGLDARANADLAVMLVDYAHERWAAGRPVSPELWRCVGPFADARALDALGHVLDTGEPRERLAAALALRACPDPQARETLARHSDCTRQLARMKSNDASARRFIGNPPERHVHRQRTPFLSSWLLEAVSPKRRSGPLSRKGASPIGGRQTSIV